MSASTAARASGFAWMSDSMAMRMGTPYRIAGAIGGWRWDPRTARAGLVCRGVDATPCGVARLGRLLLVPRIAGHARCNPPRGVIRHHFTVDVEEYFQVSAFESRVCRADWDRFESRVVGSVTRS